MLLPLASCIRFSLSLSLFPLNQKHRQIMLTKGGAKSREDEAEKCEKAQSQEAVVKWWEVSSSQDNQCRARSWEGHGRRNWSRAGAICATLRRTRRRDRHRGWPAVSVYSPVLNHGLFLRTMIHRLLDLIASSCSPRLSILRSTRLTAQYDSFLRADWIRIHENYSPAYFGCRALIS